MRIMAPIHKGLLFTLFMGVVLAVLGSLLDPSPLVAMGLICACMYAAGRVLAHYYYLDERVSGPHR